MIQDTITQLWVKITGRKIEIENYPWLGGIVGDVDIIDDKYFTQLAQHENLVIERNHPNSGLLEDLSAIDFSEYELNSINPIVKDFYLNTSNYDFEVWSEWVGIFKPFGKLLTSLFSKRLQQLNIPTRTLDVARGLHSEIVKLKKQEKTHWTIWYRKMRSTNDVIYSGVYTTCYIPHFNKNLLKVVFPLPNGNASVIMTKEILEDGSLLLSSDGKSFGQNGFYFYLTDRKGNHWAKFVKVLHEWIKVYVDEYGQLRTDHSFRIYGINFLNLHYKITRKSTAGNIG